MTKLKETIARLRLLLSEETYFRARQGLAEEFEKVLDAAEEVEKLRADKERMSLLLCILNEHGIDGLDKWLTENIWRPYHAFNREAIDAARDSLQTNGRVSESTPEAKQEASPARKEKAE